MKFIALLKKELRICLPWLLLAAVVFVIIGAIVMKDTLLNQPHRIKEGYNDNTVYYLSTPQSPIAGFAPLILITALALGIILAVVQFFLPGLHNTWAFTIHRSIKPQVIIWSKFTATGITFLVSLGLFWTLFYNYAAVPGRFYLPIFFKTYIEGWVNIIAGLMIYWGIALSAVSTAHIYTTRLLGLAVAAGVIFMLILQASIISVIIAAVVGACILIIQIFHTFLSREF